MLRVAARRLSSLSTTPTWKPAPSASAFFSGRNPIVGSESSPSEDLRCASFSSSFFRRPDFHLHHRGFASESLAPRKEDSVVPDVPATVTAIKNPTSKIVYDEYNHERFPP
ncbi:hypothetical protein CRG98_027069, partial [Punica granatum]